MVLMHLLKSDIYFLNDDFKSLALQLSVNLNDQETTIGLTNFKGRQLSGYANLIFQQELGKNPEENYTKLEQAVK